MKKGKRILSLLAVLFLLSLYITTLIVAIFTTKETGGLFFACIFATISFPVLIYAYQLIYRVLKNENDKK
ncbi:hypothetical protein [Anaeromicropila populeti]|uniref:Uncharacterized protein n=1 Tax=Anaeromicropila populeti TaxID=37658 RepID=A0A1I6JS92_9FIRM|nr:hypothetical protein [Anaeromicropila populeti]SFR81400.1 hypothetical protein SAMN05661086_01892 [Anaeromicropila populeti]